MPQIAHNNKLTVVLRALETLTITTGALTTATVRKLPDSAGGTLPYIAYEVPASTIQHIGPFFKTMQYEISASNGAVTYAIGKLEAGRGSVMKVVETDGTTAVDVFGANGAPAAYTIRSIVVVALDVTAGNIVTKNGANTVATVAKGIVSGVPTGAAALANTALAAGAVFTVESSSAGNARVVIGLDPA